jgi:hypothetical protein
MCPFAAFESIQIEVVLKRPGKFKLLGGQIKNIFTLFETNWLGAVAPANSFSRAPRVCSCDKYFSPT